MGLIIVTKGYTWIAVLVLALWMAIKSGVVMPAPLSREAKVNPIIALNVERMLMVALGLGWFIAGAAAFADLFPPIIGQETTILVTYCGL